MVFPPAQKLRLRAHDDAFPPDNLPPTRHFNGDPRTTKSESLPQPAAVDANEDSKSIQTMIQPKPLCTKTIHKVRSLDEFIRCVDLPGAMPDTTA